jgi:serine/threonine-protein kinase
MTDLDEAEREEREELAEAQALVGKTIGTGGKYVIRRLIGRGGMAFVFEAENRQLHGRRVAVKVLKHAIASIPSTTERFKREVLAMSKLTGANICDVLEYGEMGDGDRRYYMVMEYLEGQTLEHELLQTLRIHDEVRLLDLAIQACHALEEAHGKGIIHRDLKPANIFLAKSGRGDLVKVMDFGIAKVDPQRHQGAHRLTSSTETFGTPWYMSPEQVKGQPNIDGRADLYSLGIVIYEMAVGQVPFGNGKETPVEILAKQLAELPQPMLEVNPTAAVSPDLERIVAKLLQKKPDERYATATELRGELENLRDRILRERARRSTSAFPPRPTETRRERESAPTMAPNPRHVSSMPPIRPADPKPAEPKKAKGPVPKAVAPKPAEKPAAKETQITPPKARRSSYTLWILGSLVIGTTIVTIALMRFGPGTSASPVEPTAAPTVVVVDAATLSSTDVPPERFATVAVEPPDAGTPAVVAVPPPPPAVDLPSRPGDSGSRRRGRCIPNFFTGETCP